MRVELAPILDRDEYSAPLVIELRSYLNESVFELIRGMIGDGSIRSNSINALHSAILSGDIQYRNGKFVGGFSAEISKTLRTFGASKVSGGFEIELINLPFVVRQWIRESDERRRQIHQAVAGLLLLIGANILTAPSGIPFANTVDKVISDLQRQFVGSVSRVELPAAPSPVSADLVTELREQVSKGITTSIQNFSTEQTKDLRAKVLQNLESGGSIKRLSEIVESAYGVAQRKAEIIARAETSLAVARFRQVRYESLGITHYRWETSHDERVRPTHGESNNHRVLDGRTFSWGEPPVVDPATGRRRHPGQDYGPCRCVPIPILELT